jgi:hypothetical protein
VDESKLIFHPVSVVTSPTQTIKGIIVKFGKFIAKASTFPCTREHVLELVKIKWGGSPQLRSIGSLDAITAATNKLKIITGIFFNTCWVTNSESRFGENGREGD